MPSSKTLSEQEHKDVHDAMAVLLAVAGDCKVAFNNQVGGVIARAWNAVRLEHQAPLALQPSHKKRHRLVLPPRVRAEVESAQTE